MCSFYSIQFILFSLCVHIFTIFTYLVYYNDIILSTQEIQPNYDYIIVGCGTAGSVIAHRLATETNYTFIVLEAGSRSHALLEAPVLGPFLHSSLYDWQYQTVPQQNACFAMKDRKCKLTQGKIIGGSSKLNNMIYIRGNLTQYSEWFHGKYDEDYLRKQFEFIEKNIIHVNSLQYQSEFAETVLKGAKELGYNTTDLANNLGFMKSRVSQKNGKRWSTSDNLDISKYVISNALVEKVIFNGNTAIGVTFAIPKKTITIYANKGIILSTGAINTPKILQLSGIGPKKLLKSLNIPVIKNLPVGRNLQDHIGSGLDFVLFNRTIAINPIDMINPYNVIQYLFNGKGPWTTPGCEAIGLLSTKNESTPDILIMALPVGISSDRGSLLKNNINLGDDAWDKYFSKTFSSHATTIFPIILNPKSKGSVFINNTDPRSPPLIDPKYLSRKEDLEVLRDGMKFVMKLVKSRSFNDNGGYLNTLPFPGCEQFEIFTDLYFECYIKYLTLTSYHPSGTCAMGLPDSKNTVVDTSFKVLGVNRLYVADASVLPTIPSCNINAAVAMMASVFFDTNINVKMKTVSRCINTDFMHEYLYQICIN